MVKYIKCCFRYIDKWLTPGKIYKVLRIYSDPQWKNGSVHCGYIVKCDHGEEFIIFHGEFEEVSPIIGELLEAKERLQSNG